MFTIDNVSEFLSQKVAPTLRQKAAELKDLRQKLAAAEHELARYRQNERFEKLATMLEDKGQFANASREDRVEYVRKAAEAGADLGALEAAAAMLGRGGSLGTVSEKVAGGDSKADLVATIMTGTETV